jgi:Skp family chaperone for outer membrane proteins
MIGSVVVLGAAIVGAGLGGYLSAQPPKTPAAPATSVLTRTRVALVNMHVVLKQYSKYNAYKTAALAKEKEVTDQLQAKQTRLEKLAQEVRDKNTTEQRKTAIEAEARTVKFEMDNIRTEGQKTLVKFSEDELSKIYREVYQVVSQYAVNNGIDIVIRYMEDWEDYNAPAKIVGRMQIPIWPMYYDRSLEITGPIVDLVNKQFGAAAGAPPANNGVMPVSGNK